MRLLTTSEDFKPFMHKERVNYGDVTVTEVDYDLNGICKAQDKETLKAIKEAIYDYAHDKISFERLAELLEINLYELDAAFRKRGEMPSDIYKAVGEWLEKHWNDVLREATVQDKEIEAFKRGEMPEEVKW